MLETIFQISGEGGGGLGEWVSEFKHSTNLSAKIFKHIHKEMVSLLYQYALHHKILELLSVHFKL